MNIITISPKYQIVIPKNIRKKLNIKPGQKFQVLEYKGRIELIPQKDISELRGFVKGINTESIREKDRI
jgi:AbrB family looped-hinge helix DNA binding protein